MTEGDVMAHIEQSSDYALNVAEYWQRRALTAEAKVERLREARTIALAELTGLDSADLDEHERACLQAAIGVLRDG